MSEKLDFRAIEDEDVAQAFGDQAEILGTVIVKCLNRLEKEFPVEAAGTDPVQWGISLLLHVAQHIAMRAPMLDLDSDVEPEEMVEKLKLYMAQDLEQGMTEYRELYHKKMEMRQLGDEIIEKLFADLPTHSPN